MKKQAAYHAAMGNTLVYSVTFTGKVFGGGCTSRKICGFTMRMFVRGIYGFSVWASTNMYFCVPNKFCLVACNNNLELCAAAIPVCKNKTTAF